MSTATKARRGRKLKNDAEIRVRLNAKTKEKAARFFKRHGLTTGDAVRLIIDRAAADPDRDSWLAYELSSHIPNAETREAIEDSLAGRNMEEITLEDLRRQWDEA